MEREDYFFGPPFDSRSEKIYALVVYDIVDNKQRNKFAKLLNGYGYRVQKSGFEINVTRPKFEKLISLIPRYCTEIDTIRIYKINVKSEVIKWGIDRTPNQEDVIMV